MSYENLTKQHINQQVLVIIVTSEREYEITDLS